MAMHGAVLHPATQQPLIFPAPSNSFMAQPTGSNEAIQRPESTNEPPGMPPPMHMRPAYRFKSHQPPPQQQNTNQTAMMNDVAGPGRRLRTNVGANVRRHLDYVATVLKHLELRLWTSGNEQDRPVQQPDALYGLDTLPVVSRRDTPVDCVLLKFVRSAINKVRCPIFSACWSPEGKRLITGASTGEFTLWNGVMFNFETILQAHDTAIRALEWAHSDNWLVSADNDGFVKYWQPNMNNVHMYQAHKEAVRSISFCPTDIKLATGSDDATARIWDFARCTEECILRGHGSDVRCVDWHPYKSLLATASRDSQQPVKLWDARSGQCLATLHDHKNSVMACEWNQNGNWLLTGSRDHLIKLYDIRIMRETMTFRGHNKEVTSLAWHPIHEGLFASGGGDGALMYWSVDHDSEMGCIERAHEQAIWTLQWHPLGHVLASGSNDYSTKFWSRSKPGDTLNDFHDAVNSAGTTAVAAGPSGSNATAVAPAAQAGSVPTTPTNLPGMGLDLETLNQMEQPGSSGGALIPGLGGGAVGNANVEVGAKKTLIKQPPVKKVQRQFERVWNVSKPQGDTAAGPGGPGAPPRLAQPMMKTKQSLLGPAPSPGDDMNMNPPGMSRPRNAPPDFSNMGPSNIGPPGPRPGMPPNNFMGNSQPPQRPPNFQGNMQMNAHQSFRPPPPMPPPPQFGGPGPSGQQQQQMPMNLPPRNSPVPPHQQPQVLGSHQPDPPSLSSVLASAGVSQHLLANQSSADSDFRQMGQPNSSFPQGDVDLRHAPSHQRPVADEDLRSRDPRTRRDMPPHHQPGANMGSQQQQQHSLPPPRDPRLKSRDNMSTADNMMDTMSGGGQKRAWPLEQQAGGGEVHSDSPLTTMTKRFAPSGDQQQQHRSQRGGPRGGGRGQGRGGGRGGRGGRGRGGANTRGRSREY